MNLKLFLSKHSPTILTATGIAGFTATAVEAAIATPKAVDRCKLLKAKHKVEGQEPPTKWEYVKTAAPYYIPAVSTGILSAGCIVTGLHINNKRVRSATAAYGVAAGTLAEVRTAMKELLPKEKLEEIEKKVEEKQKAPIVETSTVVVDGSAKVHYVEPITGRDIWCRPVDLYQSLCDLNVQNANDGYCNLNDFFYGVGASQCHSGNEFGWRDSGGPIKISELKAVVGDDGTPRIEIGFYPEPKTGYSRFGG